MWEGGATLSTSQCLPTQTLSAPHFLKFFMEVSSQRHDPSLTSFAASHSSQENGEGGGEATKFRHVTMAWSFW